ncbi:MAG TPA: redoxin family protein [Thermoanaerobaculia bacterium]|nr:redoxin family protein [Thermoanaerobaculia bacterium]
MNRTVLIVGIAITLALVAVLFLGLGKDPTAIDSPLVGKPAPPFVLKSVNTSETIDINQLRGKPVVVNFWATWCGPCFQEHPVLVENARVIPNVQFVGVVFNDTADKINAFLHQNGSSYPTLLDEQGKTAIEYGVGGVPETFFINRKGIIVAKYVGPMSTEVLQANVAKAMTE